MEATVGCVLRYVNAPVAVALWPPVLTTTSTAPTACAGVVAMIVLALPTLTFVAALPPNVTVVVPLVLKFEPLIVTAVPPLAGPLLGDTLPMLGVVTALTIRNPNILLWGRL